MRQIFHRLHGSVAVSFEGTVVVSDEISSPYHNLRTMLGNRTTSRYSHNIPNFADAIDEKYGAPV